VTFNQIAIRQMTMDQHVLYFFIGYRGRHWEYI